MKKAFLSAAAVAAALALPGAPALAQSNEIVIGITVTTTGPAAALGIPERNALDFVPKELGGVPLKVIVLDDGGDPTTATTNARRRELAIRAAIGAERSGLIALVVRQGMIAAAIGILAGIAGGAAASSVLESVLYEVKARDPLTFAVVALALLTACAVATYLPARRAVRTNPAVVLNEP